MSRALADIRAAGDSKVMVTLLIGGNDALGSSCPLSWTSPSCPFATNFSATVNDLQRAIAQHPAGGRLIALTYYNPQAGKGGEAEARAQTNLLGIDGRIDCTGTGSQLGLNDLIGCIAAEKHVLLVDLYPALQAGGQSYISSDGTHPSAAGQAAIAQVLEATLATQPAAPANSIAPMIRGTAAGGQVLSASPGSWTGTPPISYDYQWQRCAATCTKIVGATTPTHKITSADVGGKLRVLITANNPAGGVQAASAQVGPVRPSAAQVKAALATLLPPYAKKRSQSATLVNNRGYSARFTAPGPGKLKVSWYEKHKRLQVATANVTFHKRGTATVRIALTKKGRTRLKKAKHLRLIAKATYTPVGQAPITVTKPFTV